MQPVTFQGCFGWLHVPDAHHARDVGVLLCAGISQDHSNAYRSFRLLADSLAGDGYPTLRFDYHGTGDADDIPDGRPWQTWLANIAAAADTLVASTGITRLAVIGLRAGAALAATAVARRSDVAALAMIEPCLLGRPYVTQLVTEARLRGHGEQGDAGQGGIELGELMFDKASLETLRAIDVAALAMPSPLEVAVFSQADPAAVARRLRAWQEAGISLTCERIGKLDAMLRPSQHTDEPDVESTALRAWLARAVAPRPGSRIPLQPPGRCVLRPAGCVETPIRFGPEQRLVGILCSPERAGQSDVAVVIGNSGGNPRHGFARFGVEFARNLARAGVASLRMDFAGLGDSIHLEDGAEARSGVFDTDRVPDVAAALDALQARGFRRFAIQGLCSGAYHAVQVALAEPRIDQVLAVNLPWVSLRHDPPGPASVARRSVHSLAARGVRTLLIFGEQDPGLRQFRSHFSVPEVLAGEHAGLSLMILSGIDHELSLSRMRRDVGDRLVRFLRQAAEPGISAFEAAGTA